MKKSILVICLLLISAVAFSETIFGGIPKLSGRITGEQGFYCDVTDDGKCITLHNDRGAVDILAVTGDESSISLILRLRNSDFNGPAVYFGAMFVEGYNNVYELLVWEEYPHFDDFYCLSGITNDSAINCRDAPGMAGARIGQVQKDTLIPFTGGLKEQSSIDGATDYWYSFNFNGTTAWMYGKYISFSNTVTLESYMFSGLADAGNDDPVSLMDIEVADTEYLWDLPVTEEVFDTGVSIVTIENDGQGEYSTSKLTIRAKDGTAILLDYPLPYGPYWKYDEDTARLYYATARKRELTWNLSCIDCTDGSDIVFNSAFNGNKATLQKGIFDVTRAGDKLACLAVSATSSDPELMIIDLKTLTSTRYTFPDSSIVPDRLAWINDDELFLAKCLDKREYTVSYDYNFYRVSFGNGRVIVNDSFSISGEFDNPDNPHSCLMLPSDEDGKLFLFLAKWGNYIQDYLVSFTPSGIRMDEIFGSAHLINQFWYEGNRYFAAHDEGDYWNDIVIYDNSLREINRDYLTVYFTNYLLEWVGVHNGKLIVIEINNK